MEKVQAALTVEYHNNFNGWSSGPTTVTMEDNDDANVPSPLFGETIAKVTAATFDIDDSVIEIINPDDFDAMEKITKQTKVEKGKEHVAETSVSSACWPPHDLCSTSSGSTVESSTSTTSAATSTDSNLFSLQANSDWDQSKFAITDAKRLTRVEKMVNVVGVNGYWVKKNDTARKQVQEFLYHLITQPAALDTILIVRDDKKSNLCIQHEVSIDGKRRDVVQTVVIPPNEETFSEVFKEIPAVPTFIADADGLAKLLTIQCNISEH